MPKRAHRYLAIWGILGVILLTQYQNCGQVPQAEMSGESTDGQKVTEWTTIEHGEPTAKDIQIDDPKPNFDLSFIEQKISLHANARDFSADGLCAAEQDGAVLKWHVMDNGQSLVSGLTECRLSGFKADVTLSHYLDCQKTYQLEVRLGHGAKGRLDLKMRCFPDKSIFAQNLGSDIECYYEQFGNSCKKACYRHEKLVSEENASASYCQ